MSPNPTAAILLIGNELLSGRTADANLPYMARRLSELGVELKEAAMVPDDIDVIISTLTALRQSYTYVFTTGGIGPTHDDITMQCVADSFGVSLAEHAPTVAKFKEHYAENLTPATLKMAQFPKGAKLINNPITHHPGCQMHNVFVLAGIPKICHAMFEACVPHLQRGESYHSRNLDVLAGESKVSAELNIIQQRFTDIDIGSYPFRIEGPNGIQEPGTSLVARGTDAAQVEEAYSAFVQLADQLGAKTLNT